MLCEITPEPKSIGDFLIVLGFLASVGVNVATLLGQRTKQKREVSFAESYVSQVELKALSERVAKSEQQIEMIREKMENDKLEILKAGEERAAKLYDRINLGIQKVDGLMGAFSEMRRQNFDSHREGI
jgi:ACT domain-containing protein